MERTTPFGHGSEIGRLSRDHRERFRVVSVAATLLLSATVVSAVNIGADWAESRGGKLVSDAAGKVVEADFRASWITDADLAVLGTLTTLKRIDLSHTRITDIGFQHLKSLPSVEVLNLYYAEQIGDGAMAAIKNWKHLRELNVCGTKITDVGAGHIAAVASLESLNAGYALVTDAGFEPLANLPNLHSLSIGGN